MTYKNYWTSKKEKKCIKNGATTLTRTTFGIATLSIMELIAPVYTYVTQHKITLWHDAECHGIKSQFEIVTLIVTMRYVIMISVVILNAVALL
jgi:hypothetical protein